MSKQAPRYLTASVMSAASDWIAFVGLGLLGVGPVGAQSVSRLVGGVVSFVANKLWTYEAAGTQQTRGEVVRFGLLYAFSFTLSLGLLTAWVELVQDFVPVGKFLTDGLCFVVNFLVMRGWVFGTRSAPEEHPSGRPTR